MRGEDICLVADCRFAATTPRRKPNAEILRGLRLGVLLCGELIREDRPERQRILKRTKLPLCVFAFFLIDSLQSARKFQ